MNDNNRSGPAEVALVLFLVGGVIYQNRISILKFLEHLAYKIMWVGIRLAILGAICALIYHGWKYAKAKYLLFRQWMATVESNQKKFSESISRHKESVDWLKDWNRSHIHNIEKLQAELEKLKTQFEPKKEVVKAEATQKIEEAAQEYAGNPT